MEINILVFSLKKKVILKSLEREKAARRLLHAMSTHIHMRECVLKHTCTHIHNIHTCTHTHTYTHTMAFGVHPIEMS